MNTTTKTSKTVLSILKSVAIVAVVYAAFLIVVHLMGGRFMTLINLSNKWEENEIFQKPSLYYYMENSAMIRIEIDEGTKTEALKTLISQLDNANSDFIGKCKTIDLSCKDIYEAANIEEQKAELAQAAADGTHVYFNDNYMSDKIFYHEMSHIYDLNHGSPSQSDEFQKLYERDEYDAVLELAEDTRRDNYEGWASGSALYWRSPDLLQEVFPEGYEYFNSIYSS